MQRANDIAFRLSFNIYYVKLVPPRSISLERCMLRVLSQAANESCARAVKHLNCCSALRPVKRINAVVDRSARDPVANIRHRVGRGVRAQGCWRFGSDLAPQGKASRSLPRQPPKQPGRAVRDFSRRPARNTPDKVQRQAEDKAWLFLFVARADWRMDSFGEPSNSLC